MAASKWLLWLHPSGSSAHQLHFQPHGRLCDYQPSAGNTVRQDRKQPYAVYVPIMVVCVACCGILPLATSIEMAGQFTGFMETYGFTGMSVRPIDFTIAAWPCPYRCSSLGNFPWPEVHSKQPVVPIEALEKKDSGKAQQKLSPVVDKIGIFLFFTTIICLIFAPQLHLTTWFVALVNSLLMVLFGVVDQKSALPRYSLGYADALCRRTGSGYCTDQYRCR